MKISWSRRNLFWTLCSLRKTPDSSAQVCPKQGVPLSEGAVAIPDKLSERRQIGDLQQPGWKKHYPFAIDRKNFLFANIPKGATGSAVMSSLIQTALENGLDPYNYLTWLLRKQRMQIWQMPRLCSDCCPGMLWQTAKPNYILRLRDDSLKPELIIGY